MSAAMQLTPEQLANTPAQPPPPGITPNFTNPETNAPQWTAGVMVVTVLMLVVLGIRLYSKIRIIKKFGADDWAALIGGIVTTILSAVTILLFWRPGFATHSWDVPLSTYFDSHYYSRVLAVELIGPWATYFAKLSILLFMLTIFPWSARKITAFFLILGIVINTLFYIAFTISYSVICVPRPGSNGIPQAPCTGGIFLPLGEAVAATNMGLDIYVLLVAIPTVLFLQMNGRRKFGVILVLSTGLLACVCSIFTLLYRISYIPTGDPSWDSCVGIALGVFEAAAGVITACLPCIPAAWKTFSPKVTGSWRRLLSAVTSRGSRTDSHGHSYGRTDASPHGSYGGSSTDRMYDTKTGVAYKAYNEHELSSFGQTGVKPQDATARNAYEV